MTSSQPDIHDTLEYRTAMATARLLPAGLFLIFAGLFALDLSETGRKLVPQWIGAVFLLTAGFIVSALALWRRFNPGKPHMTLSPAGIHCHIPRAKGYLIPWHEVQGVETIVFYKRYWNPLWFFLPRPVSSHMTVFVPDATAVVVSKTFYESKVAVHSHVLLGPSWKANFIPKGDSIQVVLHHGNVSVEAQDLRREVETRWQAFRDRTAGEVPTPSVPPVSATAGAAAPKANVVMMGYDPRSISRWEAIKTIVPLIGVVAMLANLCGLWAIPGQNEERAARAKANEQRDYWQNAMKRNREESKALEAADKERTREREEFMRRTFGR